MGDKWQEYKNYVTNPPPHLIARIEYRGHFLNILGVLFVSIVLIVKGFWYAIFAFIFSIMVSYAQGMAAIQRYRVFAQFLPKETYEYILDDKSWTRKKQRLFKKRYNRFIRYLVMFCSFISVIGILGLKVPIPITWTWKLFGFTILVYSSYVLELLLLTAMFYFIFVYLIITNLIESSERRKIKDELEAKANLQTNA